MPPSSTFVNLLPSIDQRIPRAPEDSLQRFTHAASAGEHESGRVPAEQLDETIAELFTKNPRSTIGNSAGAPAPASTRQQLLQRLRVEDGENRLTLLVILAIDPNRPPDWRWELLTRDRNQAFELPDPAIRGAAVWCKWGCLPIGNPHLTRALQIARTPPLKSVRDELEARLLANQGTRAIARAMKMKERVVSAFEQLFFDVRVHLKARDYIHTIVLRTDLLERRHQLSAGWLWRAAAYIGGLERLEELLATYRSLSPSQQRAGIEGYLNPVASTSPALRDWIVELFEGAAIPSHEAAVEGT